LGFWGLNHAVIATVLLNLRPARLSVLQACS